MKRRGDKIVMVTAYDAPGARFAEDAGIDVILVGDTAAMVVLGHSGTTPVTIDEMLFLTRTVSRQVHRPIVVGDLPFGSYEASDVDAVRTAVRFVKEGGADIVKLEGAGPMVSRARAIVEAGDRRHGSRRADAAVGDDARRLQDAGHGPRRRARRIVEGAKALEDAGCCSLVLEAVPAPVAAPDHRELSMPTIGIGAGSRTATARCSSTTTCSASPKGRSPVSSSATRSSPARSATRSTAYAAEVRSGAFPEEQHTYAMPEEEQADVRGRPIPSNSLLLIGPGPSGRFRARHSGLPAT